MPLTTLNHTTINYRGSGLKSFHNSPRESRNNDNIDEINELTFLESSSSIPTFKESINNQFPKGKKYDFKLELPANDKL